MAKFTQPNWSQYLITELFSKQVRRHVELSVWRVSLSKDVFERRTSTGSALFSFLDNGFAYLFGQIVSIIVKTLRNTNLVASRCFKKEKDHFCLTCDHVRHVRRDLVPQEYHACRACRECHNHHNKTVEITSFKQENNKNYKKYILLSFD